MKLHNLPGKRSAVTYAGMLQRLEILRTTLRWASSLDRPEIQKEFVSQQQNVNEASLLLDNIRCAACLWLNEKHLRSLPGVIDVG